MNTHPVLDCLASEGVVLFLRGNKLRFRAAEGNYTASLRALVEKHRNDLVRFLTAERATALADARRDIEAITRRRPLLGEVLTELAERYNAEGDPLLLDLPATTGRILDDWRADCRWPSD